MTQVRNRLKYEKVDGNEYADLLLTEKIEQQLINETDKCTKAEQENSRLQKIVNNICTVVSRIRYQINKLQYPNLTKGIEITFNQVEDQMSICCLRLEKFLAILSKKKDTIRVESVNTDS